MGRQWGHNFKWGHIPGTLYYCHRRPGCRINFRLVLNMVRVCYSAKCCLQLSFKCWLYALKVRFNISIRKCKTKTSDEHKMLHSATISQCVWGQRGQAFEWSTVNKDLLRMGISWEEVEVAAQNRSEWRRSVAQCIHLDAGWIKVKVREVCYR